MKDFLNLCCFVALLVVLILDVVRIHNDNEHGLILVEAAAWTSSSSNTCSSRRPGTASFGRVNNNQHILLAASFSSATSNRLKKTKNKFAALRSSSVASSSSSSEGVNNDVVQQPDASRGEYTKEELVLIASVAIQCKEVAKDDDVMALRKVIYGVLPTMSPSLIMKLRQEQQQRQQPAVIGNDDEDDNVAFVAHCMNIVMTSQIDIAKETLLSLLNAGEIRKLDNLIGKAARDGKLDVAFFNVLTANIKDSMDSDNNNKISISNDTNYDANEQQQQQSPAAATAAATADRTSILRHIYTRCQEEVEKTLPPGTALLNKLLRTDQQSIRSNLYKHYLLTPSEEVDGGGGNVITTPDGKTVTLHNVVNKSLIDVNDFVQAIDSAVLQIRTMENTKAITRDSAAQMVEACRMIAKETRTTLLERYGTNSTELRNFQNQLEPVFRPTSPASPYIKGQNP